MASAVLHGDRGALRTLFDRHYGAVYRYCLRSVSAADAEELAADTLRQAMRRIETYRGDAALSTWISRVARSQLSMHFRQTTRRPKVVSMDGDGGLRAEVDALATDHATPEQAQADADRQAFVHEALDALPAGYGDVLEWKYIEGLSVAEIAGRLSTTTLAVQSRLARARTALREQVAGSEFDPVAPAGDRQ